MRKSEWRKRLNKLVKDPKKVDQDVLYNWRNEARDFRTCATGERKALLESVGVVFDSTLEPKDPQVLELSYAFDRFFGEGKYRQAMAVLDTIDDYIKTMKKFQIKAHNFREKSREVA